MSIRTRIALFYLILVIIFSFSIFLPWQYISAKPKQNKLIDCIIVQYSRCAVCRNIYTTKIGPFYHKYQDNENLSFTFFDASTSDGKDLFLEEMEKLNINVNYYGGWPWVIFVWNNGRDVVVLDESSLDLVETAYKSIISNLESSSSPNADGLFLIFESVNPILVLNAIMIVFGILILFGFGYIAYRYRWKHKIILKRISIVRMVSILFLSIASFFALIYQILDYYQGGCGCLAKNIVETLKFNQYNHINLLGIKIPIALIGFVFICSILLQTIIIGTLPCPLVIKTSISRQFTFTKHYLLYFYYFLAFQMVCAFLTLFYLIYVEIFVINYICLLCTISQITILLNTILVVTWEPINLSLNFDNNT